ncbi:MAG: Uma2 family endonuclease [Armatimonadota bacterium]
MAREKLILTYRDYVNMPDDRTRKEILGGDLYVTPAPSPFHQRTLRKLLGILDAHVTTSSLGEIFPAPINLILTDIDVVQPDLVFVRADRSSIVTDAGIQGAPDLVIEVLSPSTSKLDRGRKMDVYARAGIHEYWIVDADVRTIEIFRLDQGAYRLVQRALADGTIHSEQFAGLAIPLSGLWS